MLSYLKDNPAALLDAIPTPREGDGDPLADFKTGLTPKKNFNFKFNMNILIESNGFKKHTSKQNLNLS